MVKECPYPPYAFGHHHLFEGKLWSAIEMTTQKVYLEQAAAILSIAL
jgi:hypothetical protein